MRLLFVEGYCDHRDLHVLTHSYPTRRSSDLNLPLNRLYAEPELFGCEGWENLPASAFRDFQRNVFGINYRFAMPLNNFVSCADILTLHSASDLGGERRQQVGDLELIAPLFGTALRLPRLFSALQAQF